MTRQRDFYKQLSEDLQTYANETEAAAVVLASWLIFYWGKDTMDRTIFATYPWLVDKTIFSTYPWLVDKTIFATYPWLVDKVLPKGNNA